MFELNVNGAPVSCEENKKLIDLLREDLGLTSVKNGCGEGACGSCMVLVDGRPVRACVQQIKNLCGKSVITAEGLSPHEKDVYSYAFAKVGAVQCGFCIPGMVISAKALLDNDKDPTKEQVKEAIKNNICRCTGYKKIEEAILLASKLFREGTHTNDCGLAGHIGDDIPRGDAHDKTLGTAEYVADMKVSGMLRGGAVRTQYPRAVIRSIDTSEAAALSGVVGVYTANDLPGAQKVGHLKQDWDVLIPVGKETHYIGDSVALIAAETKEILEEAKKLVKVEYEPLPPVESPAQALAEGAPKVHEDGNIVSREHLIRGDADAVIAASKYKVTNHYSLPFTEHAFLEPETAIAVPEEGRIHVFSGDQGVYQTQKECAAALGMPKESVQVTAKMVGGGFGGKEDMSVQHHAAILAKLTGRPVRVSLSRQESILVHPKRHAMEITMTTACDANGRLTAMRAEIISDTGAYASLGGPVLQRACTHAAGPYNYQDIDITGMAVYTNNPPAGAFRGFGVTQSCFATECNVNQLAGLAGLSPWEFRFLNAIRPGDTLPNGQIADDSTALVETLLAVKPVYDENPGAGIACAMKNAGLGVGVPDFGRCRLTVKDGKVHIATSAACIGQGLGTVVTQMVCDVTGLNYHRMVHDPADTFHTPDSGNTTASRQTVITGEAAREAAQKLASELQAGHSLEELEGREFYGEFESVTDKMGSPKPHPVSHISYGYATQVCVLDADGMVSKIAAAHDIGRAINPKSAEGQIEGGVVMCMGYALTEDYPLKDCVPTAKFGTLGLLRSTMAPEIETIIIGRGKDGYAGGAKGIGEIAAIPAAPAIQLAYYNRDGKFRTKLPLEDTPYSKKKGTK